MRNFLENKNYLKKLIYIKGRVDDLILTLSKLWVSMGAFQVTYEAHDVSFYPSLLFETIRTNDASCILCETLNNCALITMSDVP